jgi:hypothetical protein
MIPPSANVADWINVRLSVLGLLAFFVPDAILAGVDMLAAVCK